MVTKLWNDNYKPQEVASGTVSQPRPMDFVGAIMSKRPKMSNEDELLQYLSEPAAQLSDPKDVLHWWKVCINLETMTNTMIDLT